MKYVGVLYTHTHIMIRNHFGAKFEIDMIIPIIRCLLAYVLKLVMISLHSLKVRTDIRLYGLRDHILYIILKYYQMVRNQKYKKE